MPDNTIEKNEALTNSQEPGIKYGKYSIRELILYKLDRTLAIVAVGVIGVNAVSKLREGDIVQVVIAALSSLGGYMYGRSASK
jgi:hypothetical protein